MKYIIVGISMHTGDEFTKSHFKFYELYMKYTYDTRYNSLKNVIIEHDSIESATNEILKNKDILKGLKITILPIFDF